MARSTFILWSGILCFLGSYRKNEGFEMQGNFQQEIILIPRKYKM